MSEADTLRAQVLERYTSIYAFCRAHPELKRATVYLVLSGRYPGKWSFQAEAPAPGVTREAVAETLQKIRCKHCRRLDRRECMACRDQTEREGKELFSRLFAAAVAAKEATDGDSIAQEK